MANVKTSMIRVFYKLAQENIKAKSHAVTFNYLDQCNKYFGVIYPKGPPTIVNTSIKEVPDSDKHSSLLFKGVNYVKMFRYWSLVK
jgi:hypothetical protein